MNLIERYIFKRALIYSAGSLAALVLVVWIVQVLQRIDIVRTSATAAGDILWIALMLMPDLAAGVVPFAVLIGAVQALNSLNADSERAVIASAGASRRVIAKPVLALAAIGALLVFVNSNFVGPAASSAFQNGLRAINADAISLFLQPGRFEQVRAGPLDRRSFHFRAGWCVCGCGVCLDRRTLQKPRGGAAVLALIARC